MKTYILFIFSIFLLLNIVNSHFSNYDADLDNVLDQLNKFENSFNGKNIKNSTSILSSDKSTEEEPGENNIVLPIAIGGGVFVIFSISLITYFVLRKKKDNQLYAGAYASSSNSSMNNISRSRRPSYEDLVSIGCEF